MKNITSGLKFGMGGLEKVETVRVIYRSPGRMYRLIDVPISRAYNVSRNVAFANGFVEVLAATQTPGEEGKKWFQGTADDAVRQFLSRFESHRQSGADVTICCLPTDDRRASDFGLVIINNTGRVMSSSKKPRKMTRQISVHPHQTQQLNMGRKI